MSASTHCSALSSAPAPASSGAALAAPARRRWLGQGAAVLLGGAALALPAWARPARGKAAAPAYPLRAGQHYWMPELAPEGPLLVLVNLRQQLLLVYRGGIAIGYSSISSGKAGKRTPTGVFPVLEKQRFHRSNLYSNAPMPFMVRLTWDGVAIHAGVLPGYPASHGCIRLPQAFAARLFGVIRREDRVLVVDHPARTGISALNMLAPTDPLGQPWLTSEVLTAPEYWAPPPAAAVPATTASAGAAVAAASAAPIGAAALPTPSPVMLLASSEQRRVYAMQDGRLRGAATLATGDWPAALMQPGLYEWQRRGEGAALWHRRGAADDGGDSDALLWRTALQTAPGFAQRLRGELTPGATLLVTSRPAVNDLHEAVWRLRRGG